MPRRPMTIERNYLKHPAGSALITTGGTKVICAATVEQGAPRWLDDLGEGWVTAEYSMLPGSTNVRSRREVKSGKVSGRTAEIQRLIGRALRAVVDRGAFPGYTVTLDCDVLEADGGTRTAAITGACVALCDAFDHMRREGMILREPLIELVAAVSVGMVDGELVVDLCYEEDSNAEVDMNVVMTASGKLIEVQGTAEGAPFGRRTLDTMLDAAQDAIADVVDQQREALGLA